MCLLGYKKEEGWVKNGPKNKQTNQETVAKVVRSCRRSREAKVDMWTWLQLGQCSLLADSCILLINVLCKVFNPSRGDCSRQVGARSCRSVNNVRKHIDVQFRGDKTEIVSSRCVFGATPPPQTHPSPRGRGAVFLHVWT